MPAPNFDELCKKLIGEDLSKAPDIPVSSDVDKEINSFLSKNLSTEGDVSEFAKYLTMRYGGNDKSVEKELVEKMFLRIILLKMRK